jgi:SWI/SNF-related matrix-associated actin-dependent regulator of chromatin subfamily A3
VVFSEWTDTLDLIEIAFATEDIKFARLDGKMSPKKRAAAIVAFQEDPTITVFLATTGAGGEVCGLSSSSTSRNDLLMNDQRESPSRPHNMSS